MSIEDQRAFGLDLDKWFITKGHPSAKGQWLALPPHRADLPKMKPIRFSTGAEALTAFARGSYSSCVKDVFDVRGGR